MTTPTTTVSAGTPIFSAAAPISPEATTDPGELLHAPPMPGRTLYLPVSGDGGIDGQPGEAKSVNELDSRVEQLNAATLDYASEHLYSFDDVRCDAGCGDTPDAVVSLSDDDALSGVTAAFQALVSVADDVKGVIANYSGEMWVDRLSEIYSGTGTFNPDAVGDDTEAVYGALVAALESTEAAGNDALGALRITVQALRSSIAERAERRVNALDWALSVPLGLSGVGLAIGGAGVASNLYDLWKGGHAKDAGLNAISAAEPKLAEAMQRNDQAVAALRNAVADWTVKVNKNAVHDIKSDAPKPAAEAPVTDDTIRDPGGAPMETPLSAPAEGDSESADPLQSALDELLGSDPMAGMPQMGGMPSGGMPSMGGSGMPSDIGSGMGTPLSDALGSEELAKPLDDLAEDEEEDAEEPLDDVSDDEDEDTDEALTDPGEITPDELPEIGDEDDADEAVDEELPEDGETPVEPEAEIDPNSEEARTADVGNGRKVTFPTAALAGLGEGLAAPGNENKTLRLLASELGFQIPPDGQDIGKQVPTSMLREGDVLVGAAGEGIFIGTDEVLMEGGKIVPLSEAAVFDGQNQGIFRLDGGGDTAVPSTDTVETGLAQPVGDGSTSPLGGTDPAVDATPTVSTPGDVTEQTGTPGVPTDDAEEVGDTNASATAFGETDNGAGGLNPDDVFPSN